MYFNITYLMYCDISHAVQSALLQVNGSNTDLVVGGVQVSNNAVRRSYHPAVSDQSTTAEKPAKRERDNIS